MPWFHLYLMPSPTAKNWLIWLSSAKPFFPPVKQCHIMLFHLIQTFVNRKHIEYFQFSLSQHHGTFLGVWHMCSPCFACWLNTARVPYLWTFFILSQTLGGAPYIQKCLVVWKLWYQTVASGTHNCKNLQPEPTSRGCRHACQNEHNPDSAKGLATLYEEPLCSGLVTLYEEPLCSSIATLYEEPLCFSLSSELYPSLATPYEDPVCSSLAIL